MIAYRPTGDGTPNPVLLSKLTPEYCGRWIPVTEALPPQGLFLIVIVRGDNCPAFAWLKFGAGDRSCPYFVVPQLAAMGPRGTDIGKPAHAKWREDITHWYSSTMEGLPIKPAYHEDVEWGLCGNGWETKDAPLNPDNVAARAGIEPATK